MKRSTTCQILIRVEQGETIVLQRDGKAVGQSGPITTAGLPFHYGDPFDRLLIAQAIGEGLRLLTVDAQLSVYTGLVVTI
jgi:PIN domain nuclease of toxin-antitoxin system